MELSAYAQNNKATMDPLGTDHNMYLPVNKGKMLETYFIIIFNFEK